MQTVGGGFSIRSVDPEGDIATHLPVARVLGGIAFVAASVVRPGVVAEQGSLRRLVIGEPAGGDSARVRALHAVLASMRIQVIASSDVRADVWTKLMGNLGLNCVSALTHATLATLLGHAGARTIVESLMAEMLAVAAAATGYVPPMTIPERLELSARLGGHRTSTLQDVEAGRPLEVGALIGAVAELARRFAVLTPTLDVVFSLVDLRSRVLEDSPDAAH
jgi:2-dehydropantoate 2-reductase